MTENPFDDVGHQRGFGCSEFIYGVVCSGNLVVDTVDSRICKIDWRSLFIYKVTARWSILSVSLVNYEIRILVCACLSTLEAFTLGLITTFHELLWIEVITCRETEILALGDWDINAARLVHC